MLQSKLLQKKKEIPADETSNNAKLLIQAGYVFKEMAESIYYSSSRNESNKKDRRYNS